MRRLQESITCGEEHEHDRNGSLLPGIGLGSRSGVCGVSIAAPAARDRLDQLHHDPRDEPKPADRRYADLLPDKQPSRWRTSAEEPCQCACALKLQNQKGDRIRFFPEFASPNYCRGQTFLGSTPLPRCGVLASSSSTSLRRRTSSA
jgi:hypothetical protein